MTGADGCAFQKDPEFGGLFYFSSWRASGVMHGIAAVPFDFSAASLHSSAKELMAVAAAEKLVILEQVHGDRILHYSKGGAGTGIEQAGSADGMVVRQGAGRERVLFGIRHADCAAVLLRGDGVFALLHAGWRGLAAGLIEKALAEERYTDAVIAPAAGWGRYQVGRDVVDALATCGGALRSAAGAHYLDVAQTAVNQINRTAPWINVRTSGRCTIEDSAFHSFRRDGDRAGRNLTWIALAPA